MPNLATDRSLNNSQWLSIIGGVIMVVWIFARIYFEFEAAKITNKNQDNKIENVNSRIDRKFSQLEDRVKELEKYHTK